MCSGMICSALLTAEASGLGASEDLQYFKNATHCNCRELEMKKSDGNGDEDQDAGWEEEGERACW